MRILDVGGMPTSLGEIINIKFYTDLVKDRYDQIRLSFQRSLWDIALHTEASDWPQKKILWEKLLDDLGKLFFSEPPYILERNSITYGGAVDMLVKKINLPPQKPKLGHILCKGTSLNLDEEYIVITTKVRELERSIIAPLFSQMWKILTQISQKYKIVILGERVVEMRKEYENKPVFGIYDDIICNLPSDRIVDLTIPALGETVSNLDQIQQDCLIMKEAKLVITIGIGGNFCMALASADMVIGFRADETEFTDAIFNGREYPDAIITKDWHRFISALKVYIK